MALVVLCGHPCSGKSGLAMALVTALESQGREVMVVGEERLGLDRNDSYADSVSEKQARGALKSAVEHAVSRSRIVIFDSLNNIKGYRYELWCIARACGTRYVMLHCATDSQTAARWNEARAAAGEAAYRPEIFDDLAGRFEAPEPRNRWDSPLFSALPEDVEGCAQTVAAVVAAVTDSPNTTSAKQRSVAALQPTTATSNPALSATNLLAEMDRATQEVVSALLQAGSSGAGGTREALQLPRQMTASELRRHKRDFLRLATKNSTSRLRDAAAVQRMFGEYLQQQATAEG